MKLNFIIGLILFLIIGCKVKIEPTTIQGQAIDNIGDPVANQNIRIVGGSSPAFNPEGHEDEVFLTDSLGYFSYTFDGTDRNNYVIDDHDYYNNTPYRSITREIEVRRGEINVQNILFQREGWINVNYEDNNIEYSYELYTTSDDLINRRENRTYHIIDEQDNAILKWEYEKSGVVKTGEIKFDINFNDTTFIVIPKVE